MTLPGSNATEGCGEWADISLAVPIVDGLAAELEDLAPEALYGRRNGQKCRMKGR